MRPVMPTRNEFHVCNHDNGHAMSVDCWCEPVHIRWLKNRHGIMVLVVEHLDDEPQHVQTHHLVLIAKREENKSLPCLGQFVDHPLNLCMEAPWITRNLDAVRNEPPQDPNERSL